MFVVEVIPMVKGLKNPSLTYFTAKDVTLGVLVMVPLRSSSILAIVIRKETVVDMRSLVRNASFELRNIHQILDYQITSTAFLSAANVLANYNARGIGQVLATLMPKAMLQDPESYKQIRNDIIHTNRNEGYLLQRTYPERVMYYRTRAREILSDQASLAIICPTVAIAEMIYREVSLGIPDKCYLVHGSITKKKLTSIAQKMASTTTGQILVGTPSALVLAPQNTTEYIIESASSDVYISMVAPYLDTRIAVEYQARFTGARYVYADNPLTVNLWERVHNKELIALEPIHKRVINNSNLTILSFHLGESLQNDEERLRELAHTKSKFHPLHYQAIEVIKESIERKEQVFCYVARKGLAPQIVCNDCGQIARSMASNLPYSLFTKTNKDGSKERLYVCSATGERIPALSLCQFCNGTRMQSLGIGTEGFAKELRNLFPDTTVIVLDKEHVKTKKDIAFITEQSQQKQATIWVGTSYGYQILKQWNIALIVSLAPHFARASYTNEEQVLDLITKIQDKTTGMIYLQDRQELTKNMPVLLDGMYPTFFEQERAIRKATNYPPLGTLITIEYQVTKQEIQKRYHELEQLLSSYEPSILMYPTPKRNTARLVVLLYVPLPNWSVAHQDARLKTILSELGQQASIRINPRDFIIG